MIYIDVICIDEKYLLVFLAGIFIGSILTVGVQVISSRPQQRQNDYEDFTGI